jgi:hypothetical protein
MQLTYRRREATALLTFLAPDAGERRVEFVPSP